MEIEINLEQIRKDSIDLLRDFSAVLDRHGIPFWLDQGTALGIYRDNDFIPWDNDIDVCFWEDDLKKKSQVYSDLCKAGFRLFFLRRIRCVRIERIDVRLGWRSIDVQWYSREGDKAVKYFQVYSRPLIRNLLNETNFIIDAILELKHGADLRYKNIQSWLLTVQHSPAIVKVETIYEQRSAWIKKVVRILRYILPAGFLCWIKHVVSQIKLYFCTEKYRLETPASFFEDFEIRELDGLKVRLPKPTEEYVRFKFGENWRTPRQEWVYYEEDGAIKAALGTKRP